VDETPRPWLARRDHYRRHTTAHWSSWSRKAADARYRSVPGDQGRRRADLLVAVMRVRDVAQHFDGR
jgi:hypothetical protein